MAFLPRLRQFFGTLRVRLTLWNTGVVLIVIVVCLLAVREGLRYYLISEIDTVLDDEAQELLLDIERWYPDTEQIIGEMQRKALSHQNRDWHIRWMSPDREITLWASSNAPNDPSSTRATSANGLRVWQSATHRSAERELDRPGLPRYQVRVGTPTAFIEADVQRLTQALAPIALAILFLAPLGGFVLAERAIGPLQNLIGATERLRPSQLQQRLVLRGVGDELDQLAGKINQFLELIDDHVRRNREFVANAAHELRSPLTAIISSVQVTLEKQRGPEEYVEVLDAIEEECQHLSHLVNQLLQLAETDRTQSDAGREPVHLDDVVQRTVEMFGPVAEEQGVTLRAVQHPAVTTGQPEQVRQVVTNLVDNAIKFTPAGGTVTVSTETDPPRSSVILTVSDTGIGIPAVELPRIFERFYQVDRSRNRQGTHRGNGLGLSIVQALVQNHGGTIAVDSKPGCGTRFVVRLPLASDS